MTYNIAFSWYKCVGYLNPRQLIVSSAQTVNINKSTRIVNFDSYDLQSYICLRNSLCIDVVYNL